MNGNTSRRTLILAGAVGIGGVFYGIPLGRGAMGTCNGWGNHNTETLSALKRVGEVWLSQSHHRSTVVKTEFAAIQYQLERAGDQVEVIRQRIKRDFEQGQIESVDGWVLAQTELWVCAMLCLEQEIGLNV